MTTTLEHRKDRLKKKCQIAFFLGWWLHEGTELSRTDLFLNYAHLY